LVLERASGLWWGAAGVAAARRWSGTPPSTTPHGGWGVRRPGAEPRSQVSRCWDWLSAWGGCGNPTTECLTLARAVKQSAERYVAEAGWQPGRGSKAGWLSGRRGWCGCGSAVVGYAGRWLRCEAPWRRASKPGDPVLEGARASVVEEVAQRPSRDAVTRGWEWLASQHRGGFRDRRRAPSQPPSGVSTALSPRWLRCEAPWRRASKPGEPGLEPARLPAPGRRASRLTP